ncbi:Dynein heavy chain 1, axonemal [Eumeta japonica]|uniref:Dynein heavy chain 1, axonemal n=1 Tax=Eumeta variegata TaxID=151549 RepID=A0A4C1Z9X3_EUMVA|nr:Dynein heavy chain 1, axonemal [Eumeta japonica]
MNLGLVEGEHYPCPGLAFLPRDEDRSQRVPTSNPVALLNKLYKWTKVAVLSCTGKGNMWQVMTLDGSKRRMEVPRIRLAFNAENPEIFAKRVQYAAKLQYRKTEGKLRIINTIEKNRQLYNFIDLPSEEYQPPIPYFGRYPCLMKDFRGRVKENQWYSLYVLPESVSCIHLVVEECLKMLKNLTITWLNNTSHAIRMSFRDVGKGWFNIYEKKWEYYCMSKMCRFMQLVRFRMQYALRNCIERSMDMFVNLLETPCLCTYECEDDYEWDDKDLITTPFRGAAPPLFHFQLMMSGDGCYCTTDPREFERERLLKAYRKAIIPLNAYRRRYDCYADIYALEIEEYVETYRAEKHSASEIRHVVQMHYDAMQELIRRLPQYINIGPFALNVDTLKYTLISKRENVMKALLLMWAEEVRNSVDDVIIAFKGLMRKLGEKPNNIEHIFEIKEWMEGIPFNLQTQEENMKKVFVDYEVLDAFYMPLENEDFGALWEAIGWPLKISLEVHEIANDIKKAWKGMKEAQDWGRVLNQRQKLFGRPSVPFTDLNRLIKEFEPYRNLWVTASVICYKAVSSERERERAPLSGKNANYYKCVHPLLFLWLRSIPNNISSVAVGKTRDFLKSREIWFDYPLSYVDADSIEPSINEYYKTIVKCVRTFSELPKVQNVAIIIRDYIDEFRPLIPILQAVRNPGMKERHWDEFMERSGIVVTISEKQTFQMCLKQGVAAHGELIMEIAELATKEYAIEQSLDKMTNDWQTKVMELSPYKTTGTYIMKIPDETLLLLDEHVAATQQLQFSPFKAAFELRIQDWDERLKFTQKVLDEWIECQKEWMYLEPIFTSEDISRQLPMEAKKYANMERIWRRIMSAAFECPKIMIICPDSRLLDSLLEARHLLDVVSRGLAEYMELKRVRFPRFFFLSDDELLEILSQSRNPRAVQPHLRKCFENIAKVTFEADLKITQMHSSEGEVVDLVYKFHPSSNVEQWLLLLEDTMRHTVRLKLIEGYEELWTMARSEWSLRWPGQVVIAGSQTAWTYGVEEAIKTHKMDVFFHEMLTTLDSLRGLVKGDLTFFQREVLCALIVIEVHARDVTRNLVDEGIRHVSDFQWICQLRYYQIERDMIQIEEEEICEIYQDEERLDTSAYYRQFSQNYTDVRALNSVFPYANEYLGNSGRLVITPLTDRCYLTLMCAMHLHFGGAPAGPAGTGKTETTKDLAKALAVQCVVFNCSDQLDYMAMGKFFKGLAASGSLGVFRRIQPHRHRGAVGRRATKKFVFEGVVLPIKASCAAFITMNPGYAGRTELPDNLKALFRPISMMVPDYALIAEISLFSYGFIEAKILAGKITTTFRLSSEQLSSQVS